ncbi:MAG: phosphoribosylaminoimidazolesuccinocarboxamide synthase [bacterium]
MTKGEKIHEGKAKIMWGTDDPEVLIQEFKDSVTAGDGAKKDMITGKGAINCKISTLIFKLLEDHGIKTHWIETISDHEMRVRRLTMIPVEVVIRNLIAGSMAKRLDIEEGRPLAQPIVEHYLKNDPLHDPWLNDDHITKVFWYATEHELMLMKENARKINEVLKQFFATRGILLVDFKVEVGKAGDGMMLLGDEFTPDSCRLWDAKTMRKLDKDVFRRDLGNLMEAYNEVFRRIQA